MGRTQDIGIRSATFALAALLLCHGSAAAQPAPVTSTERENIEVRFLANEGFVISSESGAVLIDAFVAKPFSIYGEVPDETLYEMTHGGIPFHNARLALVSHIHEDHFQDDVAASYLRWRPDTRIFSSPQVVAAIRSVLRKNAASIDADRLQVVWPQEASIEHRTFENIDVEFLRLPHGSPRHASIENLAHIIHLGGQRVLHIGDATMDERFYEPFGLSSRNLDVALVPYWFFEDADGRVTLEKHLKARYTIAVHIPVKEIAAVKERLKKSHPDVFVLEEPMQFMVF